MEKIDISDIRSSILNGLDVSFQRLIQEKRKKRENNKIKSG